MNEDKFNIELRKFLKKVGITAQREVEAAVRSALADGTLKGAETFDVTATLEIGALSLNKVIAGSISLE